MKHSPLRGESFIGSKGSTGREGSEKLKPTLTGLHPQHAPFGGVLIIRARISPTHERGSQ